MNKPICFTIGFVLGLLITVLLGLICFQTYSYLSHGEGMGRSKHYVRKMLEWKNEGKPLEQGKRGRSENANE